MISKEKKKSQVKCGEKNLLIDSMVKLIEHIYSSQNARQEIFNSFSLEDLVKLLENMEDENTLLRKISALFLCELISQNQFIQFKFCELVNVLPVKGRVCINKIPDKILASFGNDPSLLEKIHIKDHQSDALCWFYSHMNALHNIKHVNYFYRSQRDSILVMADEFLDPLYNMIGFTIQQKQQIQAQSTSIQQTTATNNNNQEYPSQLPSNIGSFIEIEPPYVSQPIVSKIDLNSYQVSARKVSSPIKKQYQQKVQDPLGIRRSMDQGLKNISLQRKSPCNSARAIEQKLQIRKKESGTQSISINNNISQSNQSTDYTKNYNNKLQFDDFTCKTLENLQSQSYQNSLQTNDSHSQDSQQSNQTNLFQFKLKGKQNEFLKSMPSEIQNEKDNNEYIQQEIENKKNSYNYLQSRHSHQISSHMQKSPKQVNSHNTKNQNTRSTNNSQQQNLSSNSVSKTSIQSNGQNTSSQNKESITSSSKQASYVTKTNNKTSSLTSNHQVSISSQNYGGQNSNNRVSTVTSPRVQNKENQINQYGLVNSSAENWNFSQRRKTTENTGYLESFNNKSVNNYKELLGNANSNLIGSIKLNNPTINSNSTNDQNTKKDQLSFEYSNKNGNQKNLTNSQYQQPSSSYSNTKQQILSNQKDIRKKQMYRHFYE